MTQFLSQKKIQDIAKAIERRPHPRVRRPLPVPLLRRPVRTGKVQTTLACVRDYLAQLGTPRALAVWLIFSEGNHRDLLELTVDMDGIAYSRGVETLRRDYAATKLLSKADFLCLDVDRAETAISGGLKAEKLNADSNEFLRLWHRGLVSPTDRGFEEVFHLARRKIAKVLGPLDRALTRMHDNGWTPGRTTAVDSTELTSPEKYQANLDVSPAAFDLGHALVKSSGLWSQAALRADAPCSVLPRALNVVDYNVAITVPKNAKTDRLICYEPHLNVRLQRAVGVYISSRLRHHAQIDLSDQSSNQRLAEFGSRTGLVATIDLSMASDTLCYQLVMDLLPIDWVCFLDKLRSRHTLWPSGQILVNEKFSSMGNGFTFELETLVFWALSASASSSGWATAYGDDLVVLSDDYAQVASALRSAGFVINESKSFSTGFFRESCGRDYYRGIDITPVYLRKEISNVEEVMAFHNAIYGFCAADVAPHVSWARLLRRWRKSVDLIDVPWGPAGKGNGHLHVNLDEAAPPRAGSQGPYAGWDGWIYHSIVKVFTDRLVTGRHDDGRIYYSRFASTLCETNPAALMAAVTGPKAPRKALDLFLERSDFLYVKRSRSFSHEWPSVMWV